MDTDAALQFPNTDPSERIVLYPLSGGGVALEWELPEGLIEQALAAFPLPDPIPILYLRRAGGAGVRVAAADLSEHPTGGRSGKASFEMPVAGALLAELGLQGRRDGGWLLLARSNRLDAVPRDKGLPVSEEAVTPGAEGQSVPVEPGARLPAAASPPTPPAAEWSAGPEGRPPLVRRDAAAPAGTEQTAIDQPAASDHVLPRSAPRIAPAAAGGAWPVVSSRYPDPSLTSVLGGPLRFGRVFPLATALMGRVPTSPMGSEPVFPLAKPSELQQGAIGDRFQATPKGEHDHPTNTDELDEPAATRQDTRLSGSSAGSGPLAPYPSQDPAVIRGELRVFGQAAPGATLDLGGHQYHVGPGGRFSFTVALDDPALLESLLARLPGLPVAERDA